MTRKECKYFLSFLIETVFNIHFMGVNVSEMETASKLISLERVSRAFGSVLYHQVRLPAVSRKCGNILPE